MGDVMRCDVLWCDERIKKGGKEKGEEAGLWRTHVYRCCVVTPSNVID